MKYWIFQSNQVLGPYEPDDLSRHSTFGAESLVCPEGRRGTSMGDWQRAGMVPDLSVALVRAAQANGAQNPVATLSGLPPEPTLKDLAVLGSLQEKMAMLEDVVLQLREGQRVKDSELAALHQELAGNERQSAVTKAAMEHEAADLQAQTQDFKRKIAELEERVGGINRLSETIDKAVEAEKNVEHDIGTQGAALAELTKDISALRAQVNERLSAARPASVPAPASFSASAPSSSVVDDFRALPASSPILPFDGGSMPSFGAPADATMSVPMDLMSQAAGAALSPEVPAPGEPAAPDAVPAPAPKSRKTPLVLGGVAGLAVLGAFVFVSRDMGGKKAPTPASAANAVPLAAPAAPVPVPPPPPPAPAVDPREIAIDAAKEWQLPDGRRLGQVLETLSPPIGNLSPWMAEPLADNRVSVNYFAHGGGSGAPTVAYEFEADIGAQKTIVGRNPAAKAVLAGKAVPPPAPPKAKRIALKPKAKAKPAEENLDSLLATDSAAAPEEAAPAKPPVAKRAAKAATQPAPTGKAADEALLDDILKE
jgi:ABC-type transporter Mla subunit MlaD